MTAVGRHALVGSNPTPGAYVTRCQVTDQGIFRTISLAKFFGRTRLCREKVFVFRSFEAIGFPVRVCSGRVLRFFPFFSLFVVDQFVAVRGPRFTRTFRPGHPSRIRDQGLFQPIFEDEVFFRLVLCVARKIFFQDFRLIRFLSETFSGREMLVCRVERANPDLPQAGIVPADQEGRSMKS